VKGSSLPVAVRESWNLFKKHWLVSIELGFLLLIINIVYTLLLASILTMLGLPFTPVGYIIFTVLIVLMGSIFAVFRYSAWTFLFRAILEDRAIPKIVRLFQPKDGLDS
jgi:membrane-anchored glycerophosphoryl diester phosphodiesterase (GDPDase)